VSPHSLGTLIEWKPDSLTPSSAASAARSPLAGDTN